MSVQKIKFSLSVIMICICIAATISGCNQPQSQLPDPGLAQMGNPLVTVDSLQEMESRLGYAVPVLDKDVDSYIVLVINGIAESGRIRYSDGSDFNVRQGTGDISGIYGGVLEEEKSVDSIRVSFYIYEDIHYALWEKDGFTFSLTGSESLAEEVTSLISGK